VINVKIGETVQEIKRRLMVEHGIPYSESKLFLDGKFMLDPLSLNDFPSIVEQNKATITVQVNTVLQTFAHRRKDKREYIVWRVRIWIRKEV